MLVFEDLNGTLVQFSRNPIKSIANFPKECNYKRVVELTAEDYPDFSRIKRHKKKLDTPEGGSLTTPLYKNKPNSRSYNDMSSEQTSVLGDDMFSNDTESRIDYGALNMSIIPESPYSGFSESEYTSYGVSPAHNNLMDEVLPINKKIKPNAAQKESKNKPNLRLNIKRAEDSFKDALKADSKGNRRKVPSVLSSQKINSSQKNYIRKANYESVKAGDKKSDMAPSPYQMNFSNHSQLNAKLNNLIASPNREGISQQPMFKNFMTEEENMAPNSTEYPFAFQFAGTTPPMLKQNDGNRITPDDSYTSAQIANFLSHRTPPQEQLHVFTFQPTELKVAENMMPTYSGYGMENDNNSYNKNSFWGHQLNGNYSKPDYGYNSGLFATNRPSFEGIYPYGGEERFSDFNEKFSQLKFN